MAEILVVALFGLVAVGLGGPLTAGVFRLIDREQRTTRRSPMEHDDTLSAAGGVLRGGAWIGALERLAVYAAILVGVHEMIALAMAVKALGRYPELRNQENPAAAERFIIGTFVSVLWACAAAGLAIWLR